MKLVQGIFCNPNNFESTLTGRNMSMPTSQHKVVGLGGRRFTLVPGREPRQDRCESRGSKWSRSSSRSQQWEYAKPELVL